MVLKNKYSLGIFLGFASSALLMSNAVALPDEYLPSEFLTLDLSKAVLSPTPLGPANSFGPVAAAAHTDSDAARSPAHARPGPPAAHAAHVSADKPRGAARTRLAHRHRDPLDAQAMDTRIQVWPCKSGPLCKWKQ